MFDRGKHTNVRFMCNKVLYHRPSDSKINKKTISNHYPFTANKERSEKGLEIIDIEERYTTANKEAHIRHQCRKQLCLKLPQMSN